MKLDEFHVFKPPFGTVNHSLTVARCHNGSRSCGINLSERPRSQHDYLCKIGIYGFGLAVHHIGSVTFHIVHVTVHFQTQMVLCDEVYCELIFL